MLPSKVREGAVALALSVFFVLYSIFNFFLCVGHFWPFYHLQVASLYPIKLIEIFFSL